MHALLRIWPTARSALRACGRRLSAEAGDTLIEVVVAAVILVVIAVASLTGFDVANRSSADSKRHSQANQLAQQDQDRLRGLQVSQLTAIGNQSGNGTGATGNESKTYTLDGSTFTVTSSSRFVADNSGNASCTTSGTANADYVKTTSTVTWPNMAPRTAVIQEGIITPPAGGSMLVQTTDQANNPLPGVSIVVTGTGAGTTPNSSATSDANGCAIFGGLVDGAYSLNTTLTGYVDRTGNASPTSAQTVVAGATDTAQVQMGRAGQINVSFQTTIGGSPRSTNQDQFVATQTGLPAPGFRVFGTAGSYVAAVNSPLTMFPFTSPYTVYAGSCTGDDPTSHGQGSAPQASIAPGGTATVTLQAPALLVVPYSGTSGAPGAIVSGYPNSNNTTSTVPGHVTVTDNTCGSKRISSGGLLTTPSSATGALVDPGSPYGTYTVCADYIGRTPRGGGGYNYFAEHQVATVNSNNPAGSTVPIYFGSYVNGACP